MSKQTAVEWLVKELQKHYVKIDIINTVVFYQAKEMEKEQIMKAFEEGNLYHGWALKHEPEQYYNETYKNEEK